MMEWSPAIIPVLPRCLMNNNTNVPEIVLSRPLSRGSPEIRMMTPQGCFERTAVAREEATAVVLEATVVKGQERSRCPPTAQIRHRFGDRSFSANHRRSIYETIGLQVPRPKRCLSLGVCDVYYGGNAAKT